MSLALSSSASTAQALSTAASWSEEPTVEQAYTFSEVVTVDWLQIPVVVRDKKGRPLASREGKFSLLVDGKALHIDSFHSSTEQSVQLLFLQDLSGSMATDQKIDHARAAVRYLIGNAGHGDRFAIATFASGRTYADVPFSSDHQALRESIANWEPYGQTALHDAVSRIPELETLLKGGRYAVVLLTDGIDNASGISPEEARSAAWNAHLPVYVLGLDDASAHRTPEKRAAARTPHPLESLAELTGGRYFSVHSLHDAVEAARAVLDELRHQVTLGLVLDSQASEDLHRIEVHYDGSRRTRLHYRPNYFGRQPQAFAAGVH